MLIHLIIISVSFASTEVNKFINKTEKDFNQIFKNQLHDSGYHSVKIGLKTVSKLENPSPATSYGGENYRGRSTSGIFWIYINEITAEMITKYPDTIQLILCHELGHAIGGAPIGLGQRNVSTFEKAKNVTISIEGQADYFATLKCLPNIWANSNSSNEFNHNLFVSPEESEACKIQHGQRSDRVRTCERSLVAARKIPEFSFDYTIQLNLKYQQELQNDSYTFKFNNYNTGPTNELLSEHPSPDCRYETLVSGALCNADSKIPLSLVDEKQGTCHGNQVGSRPTCWYNP